MTGPRTPRLFLPAIKYQAHDGTRLVTAYQGQPYYRSLGRSKSIIDDQVIIKEKGRMYPFLGIQEVDGVVKKQGWVIKGLVWENGELGSRMPDAHPTLHRARFITQDVTSSPEGINAWLAKQGATPWINYEHFMGNIRSLR